MTREDGDIEDDDDREREREFEREYDWERDREREEKVWRRLDGLPTSPATSYPPFGRDSAEMSHEGVLPLIPLLLGMELVVVVVVMVTADEFEFEFEFELGEDFIVISSDKRWLKID